MAEARRSPHPDHSSVGTHTSSGEPIEQQLLKLDPANKFKWLNLLLRNYNISKKLKVQIIQADIKTTPAMIHGYGCCPGGHRVRRNFDVLRCSCAATGRRGTPTGYVPFGLLSIQRARRIKQFTTALPEAIDTMSRALRAGHSSTAAINIIAEQSVEPVSLRVQRRSSSSRTSAFPCEMRWGRCWTVSHLRIFACWLLPCSFRDRR